MGGAESGSDKDGKVAYCSNSAVAKAVHPITIFNYACKKSDVGGSVARASEEAHHD
jgi:hypothetical protein